MARVMCSLPGLSGLGDQPWWGRRVSDDVKDDERDGGGGVNGKE